MTRETKIGLLVGLAFIIVIGILLSDHLTVTAEPPQAALVQAGPSVRQGLTVPGVSNSAVVTHAPENVVPQQPVLTHQDLRQPLPGPQLDVRIGAAEAHAQALAQHAQSPDTLALAADPNPVSRIILPDSAAALPPELQVSHEVRLPAALDSHPLQQVAQRHGEALIDVSRTTEHSDANRADTQRNAAGADRTVAAREYKAASGDTLSKMAGRFYGSNTRANRDLIIRANPSLKENPNLIVAGRTYLIPDQKITTTPPAVGELALRPAPERPAPSIPAVSHYTYKVKAGDSLWKIATEQLGDTSEIATIKALNKDALKGSDVVRVGMTLKLPGKAVSSAN